MTDKTDMTEMTENFIVMCVEMAEIFENKNAKTPFFNTGPYGDPLPSHAVDESI